MRVEVDRVADAPHARAVVVGRLLELGDDGRGRVGVDVQVPVDPLDRRPVAHTERAALVDVGLDAGAQAAQLDAAAVAAPWQSANAVGVPKTGFPAETMARVAAENIAAQIRGREPSREENFGDIPAVCIMDAGNNGVVILADHMLPPRKHGVMIPGPQSHAAKLAFEKYFLWKTRHGYVKLP